METFEALMTRRSIRRFTDHEISHNVLEKLFQAGAQAPSGGNRQPWRFIMVPDSEKIKQFDPDGKWQSFVIEIPRNRVTNNNIFELVFERFPILEYLLNLFK